MRDRRSSSHAPGWPQNFLLTNRHSLDMIFCKRDDRAWPPHAHPKRDAGWWKGVGRKAASLPRAAGAKPLSSAGRVARNSPERERNSVPKEVVPRKQRFRLHWEDEGFFIAPPKTKEEEDAWLLYRRWTCTSTLCPDCFGGTRSDCLTTTASLHPNLACAGAGRSLTAAPARWRAACTPWASARATMWPSGPPIRPNGC